MRNSVRTLVLALGLSAGLCNPTPGQSAPPGGGFETGASAPSSTTADHTSAPSSTTDLETERHGRVLDRYAEDTWRSVRAMVVRRTGLPADNVGGSLAGSTRAAYTSPTNIGAYLWSTVAARDIGLIRGREAHRRMARTLDTVAGLERHDPSGMFYNWYSPTTGEKLRTFPDSGDPIKPFLSSVDNGWLATALLLVSRADPSLRHAADTIRDDMDFGCYYNAAEGNGGPVAGGQIRGGFWDEDPQDAAAVTGDYCGMGTHVWYTGHHYGAFNTEPRIASYLGIAAGQIPAKHYYGTFRTFPNDTCDWAWTETRPVGEWRTYSVDGEDVEVFEGALPYRGRHIVPTWGGSMFEALMVPLFVPEETWGPRSWGRNHPLYVQGQIEHGLEEAGYGYWGFSPSNNPAGGYREYGVDQLGLDAGTPEAGGYTSDQERTVVDQPYEGCRDGSPAPTAYGDGVVTPHASFLALRYAPRAALANLARIARDFDAYGKGGFYDSVAVRSGQVSRRHLALDQGMVMAALGNALAHDDMRRYVARGAMESTLRPLMEQEVFAR
ncbi:glucoamylase family protein [Nocardioides sp. YIM 152315]|uniref:glucoamylase family protein n=1 Tax=Nocardioides sp. YIM 152315 TaxID=3031760 RepID=UPI0023DA47F3|nr:glucoamylase family protein [Nocardioides sp. YIM 152315]MDF1605651.1 glucoamylase family protein [Nocardioides sp. YIM 152315]